MEALKAYIETRIDILKKEQNTNFKNINNYNLKIEDRRKAEANSNSAEKAYKELEKVLEILNLKINK